MAVACTSAELVEVIGGESRRLILRNAEIERFEVQYAPFGIFELWDQLIGKAAPPQVRHVRDLVALGLIGAGLDDVKADALLASLPPSDNLFLRGVAVRLLGLAFVPSAIKPQKKSAGSRSGKARAEPSDTTPASGSETSAV